MARFRGSGIHSFTAQQHLRLDCCLDEALWDCISTEHR
jgi:hypothetical protein